MNESLRDAVFRANVMLPRLGLVTMHSGNVSAYDPASDLIYIKPSGVDYDLLTPEMIVVVKRDGMEALPNQLVPSVDLVHHHYLYSHMRGVFSIVHTHSNFATAFAACELPIPCVLTAVADEFGGSIPCAPYASHEADNIGKSVLAHRGHGPAILLGKHGVIAWGEKPEAAVKAAAMVEDVAKTVWLARFMGPLTELPASDIALWNDRYQRRYGQDK